MKKCNYLFTNEIVFRGHPDKVCDQISMALLQAYLAKDPNTRAGIEVVGGKGKIFITGEVTSKARIPVREIVKQVLYDCGYSAVEYIISNNLGVQSPDIALGVNNDGAGDNGMVFGYACDDTPQFLPVAMVILQEFSKEYDNLRLKDIRFKSDGKAQITGEYDKHGKLKKIKTFTICYQNDEQNRADTDAIIAKLALHICNIHGFSIEKILINPTGRFLIGGFDGDAGLTGRKIVVDAYQSFANVGGGCMNGKDYTKVDFSGAHYARMLAKKLLCIYKLKWCEVQIGFAIGITRPLSILVKSNKGIIKYNDFASVKDIINITKSSKLDLVELAKFGHFTR